MRKRFNVGGLCYPDEHYMVNINDRLEQIQTLIDDGKYFVINRARQYGKKTTLHMLAQKFSSEYQIFSISFEGLGNSSYKDEWSFCRKVYGLLYDVIYYEETSEVSDEIRTECYRMSLNDARPDFRTLSNFFSLICKESGKPVVFIIDEVDQAADQESFLDFLGMLRDKFMKRRSRPTFRSVILAGVYDIKNLKLKIRKGQESLCNSPWNIAAKFNPMKSFIVFMVYFSPISCPSLNLLSDRLRPTANTRSFPFITVLPDGSISISVPCSILIMKIL